MRRQTMGYTNKPRLFKQGGQILYIGYTRILFRLADYIMVFRPLFSGSRHTWINRRACHAGQGAKLSLRLYRQQTTPNPMPNASAGLQAYCGNQIQRGADENKDRPSQIMA